MVFKISNNSQNQMKFKAPKTSVMLKAIFWTFMTSVNPWTSETLKKLQLISRNCMNVYTLEWQKILVTMMISET